MESRQTKVNQKCAQANLANGTIVLIVEDGLSKSSGILERRGAYSQELDLRNKYRERTGSSG